MPSFTTSDTPNVLDSKMWRLLRARCHPDAGGTNDLFQWLDSVKEHIEKNLKVETPGSTGTQSQIHRDEQIIRGLRPPFDILQIILPLSPLRNHDQEASKKSVAYLAHLLDMSDGERYRLYDISDAVGLTQWEVSTMIDEVKGR